MRRGTRMWTFLSQLCFVLLYGVLGAFFGALGSRVLVLVVDLLAGGNFLPPVLVTGATIVGATAVAILSIRGYIRSDAAEQADEKRRSVQETRSDSDKI